MIFFLNPLRKPLSWQCFSSSLFFFRAGLCFQHSLHSGELNSTDSLLSGRRRFQDLQAGPDSGSGLISQ